jgi:uncharacterized membrane protein YjjB (DUF3815 family)
MDWILFIEKGFWYGLAAIGFAVLFNVPSRSIFLIWVLAAIGGLTRDYLVNSGFNIILGSFAGATIIGFLSVQAAHFKHTPPNIFTNPAVIPMVPGVLAYRTMLGFIKFASNQVDTAYAQILSETTSNGIKTIFILVALAVGVSLPMLLSRKETIKHLKIDNKEKLKSMLQ